MARLTRLLVALVAVGVAGPQAAAQREGEGTEDGWRPRTVPLLGASYSPGLGVLLGAGVTHTRYGFRALPASTRMVAQAEYATGVRSWRAGVEAEFRQPLAPAILHVELRASGLELIRFYGFGNESDGSKPDNVYQVRQTQVLLAPTVSLPLAPRLRLALGPLVQYTRAHADSGTLLASTGPYYGAGNFGQAGAHVVLEWDTRDMPAAPASGAHLALAVRGYPAVWNAVEPFAGVSAEASTYLSVGEPGTAILALRAGGAAVSGTAPFHEMVYVGGETTVRGYAEQRFAGRAGAYTNAEVRLFIGRLSVGDLGVFGLTDWGRVWVPGMSSDRWHGAAGGGLGFAWQHRRATTLTIAAATSPERTAVYVRAGFMF